DPGGGHFARDRHAAPGAADRGILRVRIGIECGFAQDRLIVNRRNHFERGGFRICAVNIVATDDDVFEPLLAPFAGDVVGQFVIALRTCDVGLGGEDAMLTAFFVGGGNGFEFRFDCGLVGGGGGSKAEDGGLGVCDESAKQGQERERKRAARNVHGCSGAGSCALQNSSAGSWWLSRGILPAQVAASRHDSRRDGGATKSFR